MHLCSQASATHGPPSGGGELLEQRFPGWKTSRRQGGVSSLASYGQLFLPWVGVGSKDGYFVFRSCSGSCSGSEIGSAHALLLPRSTGCRGFDCALGSDVRLMNFFSSCFVRPVCFSRGCSHQVTALGKGRNSTTAHRKMPLRPWKGPKKYLRSTAPGRLLFTCSSSKRHHHLRSMFKSSTTGNAAWLLGQSWNRVDQLFSCRRLQQVISDVQCSQPSHCQRS